MLVRVLAQAVVSPQAIGSITTEVASVPSAQLDLPTGSLHDCLLSWNSQDGVPSLGAHFVCSLQRYDHNPDLGSYRSYLPTECVTAETIDLPGPSIEELQRRFEREYQITPTSQDLRVEALLTPHDIQVARWTDVEFVFSCPSLQPRD
ncbi:hypothetical protein IAU60_004946 [Kwoniella sp. DSM 27419]